MNAPNESSTWIAGELRELQQKNVALEAQVKALREALHAMLNPDRANGRQFCNPLACMNARRLLHSIEKEHTFIPCTCEDCFGSIDALCAECHEHAAIQP